MMDGLHDGTDGASLINSRLNGYFVSGAVLQGPSHYKNGLACDDVVLVQGMAGGVFVVVSDGAGSCELGGQGARIVCEAMTEVVGSALIMSGERKEADDIFWQSVVVKGVEEARFRCGALGAEQQEKRASGDIEFDAKHLSMFGATLLGAWLSEKGVWTFHIGDGSIHILLDKNEHTLFRVDGSFGDKGLYIGETYFFTSNEWRKRLRTNIYNNPFREVWLATDGAESLLVNKNGFRSGPISELSGLVHDKWGENGGAGLRAVLDKVGTEDRVPGASDDKSIVVVRQNVVKD